MQYQLVKREELVKFYYDTEFHERGPDYPIDFISIGIVSEYGATYYAVHSGFDFEAAMSNEWLRNNVMHFLPMRDGMLSLNVNHKDVKPRWKIREEIREFILGTERDANDEIELWADYADYDHVVLSQIFGRMIDLPAGFPMYTRDIQQEIDRLGIPKNELPEQITFKHHALQDAYYDRVLHRYISKWGRKDNE